MLQFLDFVFSPFVDIGWIKVFFFFFDSVLLTDFFKGYHLKTAMKTLNLGKKKLGNGKASTHMKRS